jgi:hypothetical protein|tara:strand:- start:405 stop:1205 length:801 start_codon:yes stop_codon:yes gene_type:complete
MIAPKFSSAVAVTAILLFLTGCTNSNVKNFDESQVVNSESHPGVPGFDWDTDPLKVVVNQELINSKMGLDTLGGITEDLYIYMHTMNTVDSLEWPIHLSHFPMHRYNDTTLLNKQYAGLSHWKKKGFTNRVGNIDIQYASDWIFEEDQMVALIGYDIDFYQDFLPKFVGNPEGMKFMLEDKYGRGNCNYNSFTEIRDNGDSLLVRNWHAHAYSNMYVLCNLDSLHFTFLPIGFEKADFGVLMMDSETMLTLLRDQREFSKLSKEEN